MNLFAGLEKFGLKAEQTTNLFEDETKEDAAKAEKQEEIPAEETFLLERTVQCPVCDKKFKAKTVKNGRLKRLEPDLDLRPRFEYIDTIKYDVYSCPDCGYTAMIRYFDGLTAIQRKLIKEQICANFKPGSLEQKDIIDYDLAIERYKLALFNTIAKKGKTSEQAYTCLKLAWLYREKVKLEEVNENTPEAIAKKKEFKEQEEAFYQQAYEGFMQAISKEMFPMCGMDQCTLDYLLAVMAYHFKKYDVASKCISRIQTAPEASKRIKDRVYDLREQMVAEMKQNKQA